MNLATFNGALLAIEDSMAEVMLEDAGDGPA
jgi:hypothetical protein